MSTTGVAMAEVEHGGGTLFDGRDGAHLRTSACGSHARWARADRWPRPRSVRTSAARCPHPRGCSDGFGARSADGQCTYRRVPTGRFRAQRPEIVIDKDLGAAHGGVDAELVDLA